MLCSVPNLFNRASSIARTTTTTKLNFRPPCKSCPVLRTALSVRYFSPCYIVKYMLNSVSFIYGLHWASGWVPKVMKMKGVLLLSTPSSRSQETGNLMEKETLVQQLEEVSTVLLWEMHSRQKIHRCKWLNVEMCLLCSKNSQETSGAAKSRENPGEQSEVSQERHFRTQTTGSLRGDCEDLDFYPKVHGSE